MWLFPEKLDSERRGLSWADFFILGRQLSMLFSNDVTKLQLAFLLKSWEQDLILMFLYSNIFR